MNEQKMNEQQLYEFCKQNIYALLHGKLDIDKIIKLRDINFSFDYYIDEVIKEYKSYNKEDYNNE